MRNWAGSYTYRARQIHEPTSVDQLQEIIRGTPRIRVLGSRHSFNDLADTSGDLVSLFRLPRNLEIDEAARRVTIDGAMRYGDLCGPLHAAGMALHNLASLPHISVAGACATATHGSGGRSGNLATAVRAMEVVRADGEILLIDDEEALNGVVVSLGALGAVVRLTLEAEPAYRVRQDVYEDLPRAAFQGHFDEIETAADSVSFFTTWAGPVIDQVWLKRRLVSGEAGEAPSSLFGASRARRDRHPIPGLSADACTVQRGIAGPWHERLPHFRMDHTPSSGDELQTEYFVAREHAVDGYLALDGLRDRIAALIQVSEIRTVAADRLWLSPAFERPSVTFHFTWKPDWEGVEAVLPEIESALAPFEPRPHWGKLFTMPGGWVRDRYRSIDEFAAVARRFDPHGKFHNGFLRRCVFAPGSGNRQ